MAYAVSDPSSDSVLQTPEPFVWTEDAHCLYLSFLEDAFVSDLYNHSFCSPDICGLSPSFPQLAVPSSLGAGSPSSTPPESLLPIPPPPEPNSHTEMKPHRKGPRTGYRRSSTKRKGKWSSDDVGLGNQPAMAPSSGPQYDVPFLEQPGSSSRSFECCERVVPKVLCGGSKRSQLKVLHGGSKRSQSKRSDVELCYVRRAGTDQVVPSVCEQY